MRARVLGLRSSLAALMAAVIVSGVGLGAGGCGEDGSPGEGQIRVGSPPAAPGPRDPAATPPPSDPRVTDPPPASDPPARPPADPPATDPPPAMPCDEAAPACPVACDGTTPRAECLRDTWICPGVECPSDPPPPPPPPPAAADLNLNIFFESVQRRYADGSRAAGPEWLGALYSDGTYPDRSTPAPSEPQVLVHQGNHCLTVVGGSYSAGALLPASPLDPGRLRLSDGTSTAQVSPAPVAGGFDVTTDASALAFGAGRFTLSGDGHGPELPAFSAEVTPSFPIWQTDVGLPATLAVSQDHDFYLDGFLSPVFDPVPHGGSVLIVAHDDMPGQPQRLVLVSCHAEPACVPDPLGGCRDQQRALVRLEAAALAPLLDGGARQNVSVRFRRGYTQQLDLPLRAGAFLSVNQVEENLGVTFVP